jgi:hypothetical protein
LDTVIFLREVHLFLFSLNLHPNLISPHEDAA